MFNVCNQIQYTIVYDHGSNAGVGTTFYSPKKGTRVNQATVLLSKASHSRYTPEVFNIEPENDGLEDDFPFPGVYSQVPC